MGDKIRHKIVKTTCRYVIPVLRDLDKRVNCWFFPKTASLISNVCLDIWTVIFTAAARGRYLNFKYFIYLSFQEAYNEIYLSRLVTISRKVSLISLILTQETQKFWYFHRLRPKQHKTVLCSCGHDRWYYKKEKYPIPTVYISWK